MDETTVINEFGLKTSALQMIIRSIEGFPEIDEAIIFGSRAKGNFKNGSDIDIALVGDNITFDTTSRLFGILNENIPLPYHFDVVDLLHLKHQELKDHILRVGKTFYKRTAIVN